MNNIIGLNRLAPGRAATVAALSASGGIRRRFLDLGLVPGTRVACLGASPSGDPSAYLIRGAVIAIRAEDGADILVRPERGGV